jgi:hypothetical protein
MTNSGHACLPIIINGFRFVTAKQRRQKDRKEMKSHAQMTGSRMDRVWILHRYSMDTP